MDHLEGLKYDLREFIEEMKTADLVTEKFAAMCRAQIDAAQSPADILAIRDRLPKIAQESLPAAVRSSPTEQIIRDANFGELQLKDEWIEGPRYRLRGKLTDIRIDLRAYEDAVGVELEVEFDINLGEAKVLLPYSWEFVDELQDKSTSEVKVKGDLDSVVPRNRLVAVGTLRLGSLVVKYID